MRFSRLVRPLTVLVLLALLCYFAISSERTYLYLTGKKNPLGYTRDQQAEILSHPEAPVPRLQELWQPFTLPATP